MQGENSRGFYLSQNSLAERQASCCFFLKAGFERGFENARGVGVACV
jgi:hypothetical protein